MSSRLNTKQKERFLIELTELTRKHGIVIGGCGCCGSPWLDDVIDVSDERSGYCCDSNGDYLMWMETEKGRVL